MSHRVVLSVALLLGSVVGSLAVPAAESGEQIKLAPTDWAWWRGPNRNGVAAPEQTPPLEWSEEKNILWKSAVPGRGHGSPTVVGDRVFLATADEEAEIQSMLCYDRITGKPLWTTDVHKGGFASSGRPGNPRSTKASSTIASDGHRIFINFINDNAVYLTALSLDGEQLWQQKVTDYIIHQGYGASPTVYGPLVIANADNKGGGATAAFDRVSGKPVWSHKRPESPNYASPIILKVDGKDQLLLTGCDLVSSLDPLTGTVNWEVAGATTECVTSTVSDGDVVVTSGGYPSKHVSVMKGDGSGEEIWRNETQVYVPSLLIHEGYLYGVTDSGEALCYDLATGTVAWEERLGGRFSASPVLVGDTIFAVGNDGTTHLFKADPKAFTLVGENSVNADEVEATPAICGNQIFMRVAQGKSDGRQEMLYCVGK